MTFGCQDKNQYEIFSILLENGTNQYASVWKIKKQRGTLVGTASFTRELKNEQPIADSCGISGEICKPRKLGDLREDLHTMGGTLTTSREADFLFTGTFEG